MKYVGLLVLEIKSVNIVLKIESSIIKNTVSALVYVLSQRILGMALVRVVATPGGAGRHPPLMLATKKQKQKQSLFC